jgi:hypothetical protein
MKLVRLPGHDLRYPDLCACCITRPTTLLEVRTSKAELVELTSGLAGLVTGVPVGGSLAHDLRLQVPYCGRCRGHVQWKRSGGWLGVVLHVPVNAVFGFVFGLLIALTLGAAGLVGETFDPSHPNWFIVGAGVTVGVALALRTTRFRPAGPLGPNHAREGQALEVARVSGSELVVRCHNDGFAARLIEVNRGAAELSPP